MIAVQGLYEDGRIQLDEAVPMKRAKVIVIFPENESKKPYTEMKSARKLFEEFTGSVQREIDERAERLSAIEEKYAGVD